MELIRALKHVCKFVKGNNIDPKHRYVNFIRIDHELKYLYVYNGIFEVFCRLDPDTAIGFSGLLSVDDCVRISKMCGPLTFINDSSQVTVKSEIDKYTVDLRLYGEGSIPQNVIDVPDVNIFQNLHGWPFLENIFFGASKPNKDRAFACVHFTAKYAEVTNKIIAVRHTNLYPYEYVIPIEAFKYVSKKAIVKIYQHNGFAYFSIDNSEMRVVPLATTKYIDLDSYFELKEQRKCVRIYERCDFIQIVNQASITSPLGVIIMHFKDGFVSCMAYDDTKEVATIMAAPTYKGVTQYDDLYGEMDDCKVILNGTHLVSMLSKIAIDDLYLYYDEQQQMIKLESGKYIGCQWLMV